MWFDLRYDASKLRENTLRMKDGVAPLWADRLQMRSGMHPAWVDPDKRDVLWGIAKNPGGCPWTLAGEVLNLLLASSAILLGFRCLEVFAISPQYARIYFSVKQMYMKDLVYMFPMLALLMLFFGVSFSLLAPRFSLQGSDGPLLTSPQNKLTNNDFGAGASFWQPFWSVFGDFDIVEMSSSPGASFLAPAFLFFYLFFVALPGVNLLIAMFSES